MLDVVFKSVLKNLNIGSNTNNMSDGSVGC